MGLEATIQRVLKDRIRDVPFAWWRHYLLGRCPPPSETVRRAMVERIEGGEQFATDGNELLIRIERDGVPFIVGARLKYVRPLNARNRED